MKAVRVLLLALGIVGSIAVNLTANPVDITFTTDGLIQTGDDYDDVWVYGDTTTVDMTGGKVAVLWTYDESTTNITGGLVAYAQTNGLSTINIGVGVVHEPRAWANGIINSPVENVGMSKSVAARLTYQEARLRVPGFMLLRPVAS